MRVVGGAARAVEGVVFDREWSEELLAVSKIKHELRERGKVATVVDSYRVIQERNRAAAESGRDVKSFSTLRAQQPLGTTGGRTLSFRVRVDKWAHMVSYAQIGLVPAGARPKAWASIQELGGCCVSVSSKNMLLVRGAWELDGGAGQRHVEQVDVMVPEGGSVALTLDPTVGTACVQVFSAAGGAAVKTLNFHSLPSGDLYPAVAIWNQSDTVRLL
jgi:hypothetical protein